MCDFCPPDPYLERPEPVPHVRPCNCGGHRDDLMIDTVWTDGADDTYVRVVVATGEIVQRFIPTRRIDHGVDHNAHVVQWLHPWWWLKQQTQPDPF